MVCVVADDYAAQQLKQVPDRNYDVLAVGSIVGALQAAELRAPTLVVVDPTFDREVAGISSRRWKTTSRRRYGSSTRRRVGRSS